ncbi:MAG: DNA cytosine methyltransferase, partial [Candidatus Helarchaeota archaeon]
SAGDQGVLLHNIYGGFKEGVRIFRKDSPTIRTAKGGGHIPSLLKNNRIRRLTPVECERLQGFPDGWTERGINKNGEIVKISDTQRYKMLGNAVSVPVITFLGKQILLSLGGDYGSQ